MRFFLENNSEKRVELKLAYNGSDITLIAKGRSGNWKFDSCLLKISSQGECCTPAGVWEELGIQLDELGCIKL